MNQTDDKATNPNPPGQMNPRREEALLRLLDVAVALASENDHVRLLERIVLEAKSICEAEGGTLYLREEDDPDNLQFAIFRNDALKLTLGGTTGKLIQYPPLPLHDPETHEPNHRHIACHVALTRQLINVADAYANESFDFSGTRRFDQLSGYRSKSFLAAPLINHQGDVVGVLQLINAKDQKSGGVAEFTAEQESVLASLAALAAVAIENHRLLSQEKRLLDSLVRVLAVAIDAKSPYTGGHCQRVPVLTRMLAEAASGAADGPFREFSMTQEEMAELELAAWLHDCGKVVTPPHVVDKAKRLEGVFDRVELIRVRIAAAKQAAETDYWRKLQSPGADKVRLGDELQEVTKKLDDACRFIEECNNGDVRIDDSRLARLRQIALLPWRDWTGEQRQLLDADELRNLSITTGTLTSEERTIINDHIVHTIRMLKELPYPRRFRRVPEFAAAHHERLDGRGYPYGLKAEKLSLPARMLAVADVFEALTAADRPYKRGRTLDETQKIMEEMKGTHLDADLVELFFDAGLHWRYAKEHLGAGASSGGKGAPAIAAGAP